MVRAKVICEEIVNNTVVFRTVYEDASKDTENARFTKSTPWGRIELGIDNPAALEQFAPGREYYVDFIPAAAPAKVETSSEPNKTQEPSTPAAPAPGASATEPVK